MTDYVKSLVRTYVPVAVGAVAIWLATIGVTIDSDTKAAIIAAVTGLAIAVYYAIARALEGRWPALGGLLGVRGSPQYDLPLPGSWSETTTDYYESGEPKTIYSATHFPDGSGK